MNLYLRLIGLLLITLILGGLGGCVSVAGYQKAWLNDPDMALQERKIQYYEVAAHTYREGAAGANGGKVGGGCGCN